MGEAREARLRRPGWARTGQAASVGDAGAVLLFRALLVGLIFHVAGKIEAPVLCDQRLRVVLDRIRSSLALAFAFLCSRQLAAPLLCTVLGASCHGSLPGILGAARPLVLARWYGQMLAAPSYFGIKYTYVRLGLKRKGEEDGG